MINYVNGCLNGVAFNYLNGCVTFSAGIPIHTMTMDIHGISAAIEYLGQGTESGECWHGAGRYMIPLGLWKQPEIDYWNSWVVYGKEFTDGKWPNRPVEPQSIEYWPYKD